MPSSNSRSWSTFQPTSTPSWEAARLKRIQTPNGQAFAPTLEPHTSSPFFSALLSLRILSNPSSTAKATAGS